jgi:cytosine/adenosine deaminase-related metal-dependent hydrolase
VIAHGVHLTADERALLARTGASIAHCPSANLKLASGVADVPALLEAGVNVALGADGAPCNNNLDLWREMKLAGLLPRVTRGARALAAQRVFEAATLGGARALGLDAQVGRLSVGYRADLALVDLSGPHLQPLPAQPDGRLWTALVYAVAASDVRTVVVDGRVVVRGGQLQTADGREIGRAALREQEALLVRAGLSAQA